MTWRMTGPSTVSRTTTTAEVDPRTRATVLKLAVMPSLAAGVALLFGLEGAVLLGVVITAALPTAQNIFLHATRYHVGEGVSRETILVTTVCSLPVAVVIALLLA